MSLCAIVTTALLNVGITADWPNWRGPENTGYLADANPPIEFSDTLNVRWKTKLPGSGHGSPVVSGDVIYLMTAIPTGRRLSADKLPPVDPDAPDWMPKPLDQIMSFTVLAIDRHTGGIRWQTIVREEAPHEGGHETNSFSSASCVTDGARIFANFGSRGIYALDLNGEVLWEHDLGEMITRNHWGEGATPGLRNGVLVVPWDHEGDSMVVAFDARSGEEKWRRDRDEVTAWATPAFADVDGITQVILSGNNTCIAYELDTGDEIWRTRGLSLNVTPSPIVGHGMVYLMSGYRGSALLAVTLDEATGDITDTEAIAWTHNRATPYIPSGMLAGRNLYFLGGLNGILSCFDAISGEPHYMGERLGPVQNVYSSITGAGEHFYVCGREGNVAVIREGPEFEIITINDMGESIDASPAIVGDVMYLRGGEHLFCIAKAVAD